MTWMRPNCFTRKNSASKLADHQPGHFAKFDSGTSFVTLEQKGSESYPSKDKAVLFFAVPDLEAAKDALGADRIIESLAALGCAA